MAILIIDTKTVTDEAGTPQQRHADIAIDNGIDGYLWGVGGLPLVGDLQPILNSRESELWTAASAAAISVPLEITYKQEARQFMADNPNAKLLIELNVADLKTMIENRTAGQETLLLKTLAVAVRYLYEQARLT